MHVSSILAIASQLPIKIEGPLGAVFSVGSAANLYNDYPKPAKGMERVQLRDIRRTGWT
jgi:hypothetical protein